jgi:hypothetical protein
MRAGKPERAGGYRRKAIDEAIEELMKKEGI